MFLLLILLVLALTLIMGFITQVLVPLGQDTPLFPYFRKSVVKEKVKAASKELEEVAELEQLNDLEHEINRRKAQLKKEDK